jgi:hypothetical protein
MTMSAFRAGLAVAAGIAIIAAVVATCGREDESPTTTTPGAAAAEPDGPREPPKPRTTRSPRAAPANVTDGASPTVAGTSDEFPSLDVEVVLADGTPCPGADVYALAAGGPGRRTIGEGPHTKTRAGGRGTLVLPRSGSFDVGVAAGILHGFATDVVVPRPSLLRLTLQATAEVHVVPDADAIEQGAGLVFGGSWISLRSEPWGDPLRAFGRGEARFWLLPIVFPDDATDVRALVPTDGPFRVSTSPDVKAWPETATAPATISLSPSGLLPVRLRVRFTPPDVVARADGWIVVAIDTGGGGAVNPAYHFAAGVLDARLSSQLDLTAWFPAAGGVVRWSGRGIAAGEATVGASTRTRPVSADLTIVLDGTPLPPAPPADSGVVLPPTATFDVTLTGYGPEPDPARAFLRSDGGNSMAIVPRGEVRHLGAPVPAWLAAAHGNRVAAPRRVTEAMAGPVELALEPGGFLVVECVTTPPAELGPLTLQRKDGQPLILAGKKLLPSIDAVSGNRIGPLPPGDVTFVVRLAGFDVGEVTATVRADATETLVVPHVPPR